MPVCGVQQAVSLQKRKHCTTARDVPSYLQLSTSLAYLTSDYLADYNCNRLSCFFLDAISAIVTKKEPLYHVWLREMSPLYIACDMEQHLMDHLPGYGPQVGGPNEHHDASPKSGSPRSNRISPTDDGSDDSNMAKANLKV